MTNEEIDIINSMRWKVARSIRYKRHIDVQDVMQDLFVKLIKNYDKFGSLATGTEKKNYAFWACENLLIDMHRRREVQLSRAKITSFFTKSGDEKSYPALHTEENKSIRRVLELKEEVEEVFETLKTFSHPNELLLTVDGYMAREIAASQNISINTVLGRIRYARKFLNKKLNVQENQKNKKARSNCEGQSCQRVNA